MKPAERTVRYLVERGIIACRIDRRLGPIEVDWPAGGVGFADILAVPPEGPLLIQVTSKANHASRVRKVIESAYVVRMCILRGMRVEVWSWAPDDENPRIEPITLASLPTVAIPA